MPRRNEIPVGIRLRIVEMHQAGKGYKSISKSLDIHLSTVRQIIHKWKRFKTVATLPRSGRPVKNNPIPAPRKLSKDNDEQAGPADDNGVQNIKKKIKSRIIPDVVKPESFSSDAESSNKDPSVYCRPVPTVQAEDPDNEMDDYNIVYEVGEEADSSSTDVEEDFMANHFFQEQIDDAEDPGHERAQPFDPDFNQEKKIYSGSTVTAGALLLLLLTFILKHKLSNAAAKDLLDLLDLLNLVVPGCLPKSLQFLKNHPSQHCAEAETHLYCPKCASYIGVEPGNRCEVCQQRLSKRCLLEKAHYFMVMPLEIQLRNILTRVHSKLGKHFVRDGCLSDVVTGKEYKGDRQAGSITLTFKCDGFPLLDSKFSIWPILCTINELPYAERGRNVLLHTLWFGRGRPHVQSFFTPFVYELHKLSSEGFRWTDGTGSERRTTVAAKVCLCDPASRSLVQNLQSFGCSFCYHKGELVPKGQGFTRVYPVPTDRCDLRHVAETAKSFQHRQTGVKGPSPLVLLPSFDIVKGSVPDYMHCFCLGVVPDFVDLWFDSDLAHKPFHLTPQHLTDLDKALCAIQPPSEVGPGPRRVSDRKLWTASEWRAFALLYSPVLLEDALPILYHIHWMLLVSALHILLSPFATQEQLSYAESSLLQFVAQVPSLYGLENCSFNCHLLTHLAESARDWGLLWANSAFAFEGASSRLLQMYSASKSASSQIFSRVFSYEDALRRGSLVLQGASAEMKDLFRSMTSCDVVMRSSVDSEQTLGSGSQRFLTAAEVAALQKVHRGQHQGSVTQHKCLVHNNMLISTPGHSATTKRNDSVIETSSGFAVVQSIVALKDVCSCEEKLGCSCKTFVLFCKKLFPWRSHGAQLDANIAEFLVRVRRSDELCAVTCGDVVAKCFAIERERRVYVVKMPVFEMH
ncbi:uncharacterized protein LOC105354509 isoform X2 [Oryzias latipes]|uniref:uncharacterized protein LOC105354509 isoform X2 n=1 Tax=Oryzias latipes TaxID=8090 RepID=UPI0005CC2737|nr:uncharacterized protein LOC105354509 isoform X2 [Oryzias latipes]